MLALPVIGALLLCVSPASAMMFDLIEPDLVPGCPCAEWSTLNSTVRGWFTNATVPDNAANHCAQLSGAPGLAKPAPVLDPTGLGGAGAFCFCADDTTRAELCSSPLNRPEQINLQLASSDTVVVSFVTFESTEPAGLPSATLALSGAAATFESSTVTITGVTHTYVTPSGNRTYYMHFVIFADLQPRKKYTYKVRSGGASGTWSPEFTFRSPYSSDDGLPTRVAIFGDMGIYQWCNMANLLDDATSEAIDGVVHIGDHCYNMGGEDERRGDAYMQAYQPVLTRVPWIPVVGNHEFYDGDELRRYLNQTEGSVVGNPASANHSLIRGARSTADTALGSLLSAGNHHSAGVHGSTTPSGTSRFFSTDLGLVHFVALDLNMYNGVDSCGEPCRQAQLEWLRKDLAAANANRASVPWIVAMSHFPLYCSNCPKPGHEPGAWWNSEACEFQGHDQTCLVGEPQPPRAASAAGNDDMVPDFEPLFMEFGVDVYASGHIHDYEFTYPIYNNTAVQKDFVNPRAPVHLVTGNGGPPSASGFSAIADWSHTHSSTYSYTRLTAHNASTMQWEQIANNDSAVLYELFVTQDAHGAFPIP